MKKRWMWMGIILVSFVLASSAQAQMSETELRLQALEEKVAANNGGSDSSENYDLHSVKTTKDIQFRYGSKGFGFQTGNGLFSTNLAWRAQMRFEGFNVEGDPITLSNFSAKDIHNFENRRLRMKIGGHGYKPWIKYYFEVDLQPSRAVDDSSTASATRVIDWRIDVQPWDGLGFRVGQWKINYNRERVDSSGRQQFVERSIVNREFTIDRQVGIMAQGHLFKGTLADMRYYAGVFNGEGRSVNNPDDNFMYMGRLQWNFLGRDLQWGQTDVERHKKPTGSIAFAASQNNGVCTAWSSSGCGNLPGFTAPAVAFAAGNLEEFNTHQFVEEFAFKWQGLSIQHEYHWKNITDNQSTRELHLWGSYSQIGYFFNEIFPVVPEGLEAAFRYAFVNEPDSSDIDAAGRNQNTRKEFTWGLNYFIAGHNNKVTLDFSYLTINDASSFMAGAPYWDDDKRVRLQWDITF